MYISAKNQHQVKEDGPGNSLDRGESLSHADILPTVNVVQTTSTPGLQSSSSANYMSVFSTSSSVVDNKCASSHPYHSFYSQATPLEELSENQRGRQRRAAIQEAVLTERREACTFVPDLSKAGVVQKAPAAVKLSISGEVGGS